MKDLQLQPTPAFRLAPCGRHGAVIDDASRRCLKCDRQPSDDMRAKARADESARCLAWRRVSA